MALKAQQPQHSTYEKSDLDPMRRSTQDQTSTHQIYGTLTCAEVKVKVSNVMFSANLMEKLLERQKVPKQ